MGAHGCGEIRQRVDALLLAGGHRGEDALDEAAAGTALRAEGAIALHRAFPLGALGGIVGGLHAFDPQEGPERGLQRPQIVAEGFGFGVGVVPLAQQAPPPLRGRVPASRRGRQS